MPIRPVEIMEKHTYDPDKDGIIALAQLAAAVCSEAEADGKVAAEAAARIAAITNHAGLPTVHQNAPALIATHTGITDAHHTPGSPTKQIFLPATGGTAFPSTYGNYPVAYCVNDNDEGYVAFKVPHDFSSIVSIQMIGIPTRTKSTTNWDIYANYAADGEGYTVHSESNTGITFNIHDDKMESFDISSVFSSLSADDKVGFKVKTMDYDNGIHLLGIRLRYN